MRLKPEKNSKSHQSTSIPSYSLFILSILPKNITASATDRHQATHIMIRNKKLIQEK
jgi:hypothetical protein